MKDFATRADFAIRQLAHYVARLFVIWRMHITAYITPPKHTPSTFDLLEAKLVR